MSELADRKRYVVSGSEGAPSVFGSMKRTTARDPRKSKAVKKTDITETTSATIDTIKLKRSDFPSAGEVLGVAPTVEANSCAWARVDRLRGFMLIIVFSPPPKEACAGSFVTTNVKVTGDFRPAAATRRDTARRPR